MLYTVRELSQAIGLPDRTLRDWLAFGAPHFYDQTGHIWIEGTEFAEWVATVRRPKKHTKLNEDEGYCLSCREIVEMINPISKPMKGNMVLRKGECPHCHHTVNRGIGLLNPVKKHNRTERVRHAR